MNAPDEKSLTLQQKAHAWILEAFGSDVAGDIQERCHRFLEEALELAQALGCTQAEAYELVDYVYGRPVGEPYQEVGGVMLTTAVLCSAANLDMLECADIELSRAWEKIEVIRAKQAAKPRNSALPGFAGQPIINDNICVWSLVHAGPMDSGGDWKGACGVEMTFGSDTPIRNGFAFCPACGKRIVER